MENLYHELRSDYGSALKMTSKDDGSVEAYYMTESMLPVVNFDSAKNSYVRKLCIPHAPASCDALYYDTDGYYFIEFKNGAIDKKTSANIKRKVYDSMLVFMDKTSAIVGDMREKCTFILVYNNFKRHNEQEYNDYFQASSLNSIENAVHKLAGEHLVRFGLYFFRRLYLKDVYTFTCEEFKEWVSEKEENHGLS